jgi:hypothetical protein
MLRLGLIAIVAIFSCLGCVASGSDAGNAAENNAQVQSAKKDLAQRLGVVEREIGLVGKIEEVTWPDTSLGCPEPGKMYAQMLTSGLKFTLKGGARRFEYHTGGGALRLCKEY